jgi:Cof subfamily protein (haloacid dehalogenase superfamily)
MTFDNSDFRSGLKKDGYSKEELYFNQLNRELIDHLGGNQPEVQGLFLADVDGTLLTPEKALTPRSIAAIEKLREAGMAFAIVSGRPPRGMSFLVQQLKLKVPSAAFNGGAMIYPDLKIGKQRFLPAASVAHALRIIKKHSVDYWLYCGQEWYVRDIHGPHVDKEKRTVKFDPQVVANFDGLTENVNKLVVVSDNLAEMQACEKELKKELIHASSTFSQPYYIDVTPIDANKGTVVTDLCEILKIAPSAVVTIGDMPNDILMFNKSGYSIAMGNSMEEVKMSSKYVTATNEHDGFAQAVEYFLKEKFKKRAAVA